MSALDLMGILVDDQTMAHARRGGDRQFRGLPRPGRRMEVRYRAIGDRGPGPEAAAVTSNIGVGGAFIRTSDPEPPGTKLRVAIRLPAGRTVEVQGEVRWITGGDQGAGAERGMGVRFSGLAAPEVLVLNEYFASLPETADFDDLG
jgi:uncharacterized protein (TIGR02266 family)